MSVTNRYDIVVIGASSGGIGAINVLLDALPADFPTPIAVVLHIQETTKADFAELFRRPGRLQVREAEDKGPAEKGVLYVAPPGYHLLVENDGTFSLSYEEKVNFSRPAIDVLFESTASAYGSRAIGVVLTGANADGALGLQAIKRAGGLAVVEDPNTAEVRTMPAAAIALANPDYVLPLSRIGALLTALVQLTGAPKQTESELHV